MEPGFDIIEKEDVSNLHFPKDDVLKSTNDIKELTRQLERANALGNLEHQKVKIYFEDDASKKVVHTTIWGITEQYILLKKNVLLPKNRIIKLEI